MTNNTIPNVPRELLERTIDRLKYGHEHDKALRELRAILATAKSAAADDERMRFDLWAEQQGWPKDHTMLHELWLAWKAGALKYAPSPAGVDGLEVFAVDIQGREVADCVRYDQHQAIIDGLRGEVAELESTLADNLELSGKRAVRIAEIGHELADAISERDQQAQRIGELEGLLRDIKSMARGSSRLSIAARIDTALSAGKEQQ